MKKRLLNVIVAICLILALIPMVNITATAVSPVSDEVIELRINELCNLLDGKYFNVNQDTSCGQKAPPYNHGCNNCKLANIINAQWFKNTFGTVKSSQICGGTQRYSCVGFVTFARWYIFRADNSDTVLADTVASNLKFNYDNVSQHAHIGDYFWLGGCHAVIYIGCDSNGITVLDCNGAATYNCLVKKRTIPYSSYNTFNISRSYSEKAGKGNIAVKSPVITRPTEGLYNLVPACAPNSTLDVANKGKENKANLHIWQRGDNWSNQQWQLERVDGDYYKITNKNSGKVVSIQSDSTASGSNVWQYGYGSSNAQKWRFEDAGNGCYYIVPKNATSLCLDVSAGSSANGANVQVYTKNQTNAQKWKLIPVVCTQHVKGNGGYCQLSHPHYEYYYCAICGESFTDNKEHYNSDCETCNPKPVNNFWDMLLKGPEQSAEEDPKPAQDNDQGNSWIDKIMGIGNASEGKTEPEPEKEDKQEPQWTESVDAIKDLWNIGKKEDDPEPTPVEPPKASEPTGHWGEWSAWYDATYVASSTRQVETRQREVTPAKTQYRYGNFTIGGRDIWDVDYGYSLGWKGAVKENWTEWRDTPIPYVNRKTFCANTAHNHQHVKSYEVEGWATWYLYREDGIWDGWSRPYYYWEETRTVKATYKTQYRYRDWILD